MRPFLAGLSAAFCIVGACLEAVAQDIHDRIEPNFVACAMDNQTCEIKSGQTSNIYWGAGTTYALALNKSGNVPCTEAGLGVSDPISGTLKTCYIDLSASTGPGGTGQVLDSIPDGFSSCAAEGQRCDVTGGWDGYYGVGTAYAEIKGIGAFTCSLANFHIADPAGGQSKSCYVRAANTAASSDGTIVSAVPSGFKACVVDGKICDVKGSWTGYYGANSTYATISGTGPFMCLPSAFGIPDPLGGVQKTCYVNQTADAEPLPAPTTVSSVPSGYTPCAVDGQTCVVSGDWNGYYGAQNTYITIAGSGPFTCLPADLRVDDPLYGVTKTCYVNKSDSRATATGVTLQTLPSDYSSGRCAVDGGTCAVTSNWIGYYGANTSYKQIEGTGNFVCLPETFGIADPLPYVQKACYVKAGTPADFGNMCSYTRQNNTQATSGVVSRAQCRCRCATNNAKNNTCYFNTGDLIRNPVCNPGEYP